LIASRAGIAEGTIYRHFDSKEQLLNEIYRAAVRLLAAPVNESANSLGCRDRLEHIAAVWQEIATANPPLNTLIFASDLSGLLDARSTAAFDNMMRDLEAIIADGKSAGLVRAGSAQIWADVWFKLAVLILERVSSGDWPPEHHGPRQVLDSAWTAISAPTP